MVTELKDLIKKFIEASPKIAKPLQEYRATELWDSVVDERISRHAKPLRIKNGILTVTTSSSVWAQELRYVKEEILKKLNEKVGKNVVRDIRFRAGDS